jgi:uncharacterized protein (TIGR02444 family)
MSEGEDALWTFAVTLYGRPGVEPACLHLQDSFGMDVVVLLAVLFACEQGLAVGEGEIAEADTLVRSWREEVVRPLRQVRRYLKQAGADQESATEQLRKTVKAEELAAEKIELATLRAWIDGLLRATAERAAQECVEALVRFYAGRELSANEQRSSKEATLTIARAVVTL